MNFVQVLAGIECSPDLKTLLNLVQWGLNLVCYVTPIILIVLATVDIAKIVTAGNLDDKMKKEVGNKLITRVIYAVVIFLIPTIVGLLFKLLPAGVGAKTSWWECWGEAKHIDEEK